jgi:4'-phosphopantetheinyl transferase
LARGGVEIWLLGPVPSLRLDRLPLSAEEWTRAARYVRDADRSAFVAGRVLTRVLLARRGNCDPRDVGLAPDGHGRPTVIRPRRLRGYHFSISHARGLVGVAVSPAGPIGLDLEPLDRRIAVTSLTDNVLAACEYDALRGLPAEVARTRFLRLWTLKEAYLKARGIGLAGSLAAVAFDLDPLVATLLADDDAPWSFEQRTWPTGHIVAVCRAEQTRSILYRNADEDEEIARLFTRKSAASRNARPRRRRTSRT